MFSTSGRLSPLRRHCAERRGFTRVPSLGGVSVVAVGGFAMPVFVQPIRCDEHQSSSKEERRVGRHAVDYTADTARLHPKTRLKPIRRVPAPKSRPTDRHAYWECLCACGNPEPVIVRSVSLVTGDVRSCGCLAKEGGIGRRQKMVDLLEKLVLCGMLLRRGSVSAQVAWDQAMKELAEYNPTYAANLKV
jgi:hypothetical protein